MTNAEKFEQVFNIKPDTESMVVDCPTEVKEPCSSGCKYYEDSGCHCDTWWTEDYKEIDKADNIIKRIEQARDKDKIAEYPYNRCIRIVEEIMGQSEMNCGDD